MRFRPSRRRAQLPEAALYAQAGAVCVMIDYPWVRPAPWRVNQGRGFAEPEKDVASCEAAGVDLRRALDLLVPSSESMALEVDDPDVQELIKAHTKEQLDRYFELNRPYDAIRCVPFAAPTPLFFQFARHERFLSDAAMNRYFAAASEPKLVRWYDTGHDLNDLRVIGDRAAWLAPKLGLPSLRSLLGQRLSSDIR